MNSKDDINDLLEDYNGEYDEWDELDEKFKKAMKLLIACRKSLNCGYEVNEQDADWLYYQCKSYIKDFNKRFSY